MEQAPRGGEFKFRHRLTNPLLILRPPEFQREYVVVCTCGWRSAPGYWQITARLDGRRHVVLGEDADYEEWGRT